MSFAGKWMELEIMLGEISQTQKIKYCIFSLMWNLDLRENDMKVEEEVFGKKKGPVCMSVCGGGTDKRG
jgi:hypothetical protein